MKRFRWGDVVPGFGEECIDTEDEVLELVGVYAAPAHGVPGLDPSDADAVGRLLLVAD
jgi:hypothetical protein